MRYASGEREWSLLAQSDGVGRETIKSAILGFTFKELPMPPKRALGDRPFPYGYCQVGVGRFLWQGLGHEHDLSPFRVFRFPAEIINQAVWLHHCFSLSLRDIELILAARGVVVSYETIREWSLRFGWTYAKTLKRRRPKPGDKWLLDEVFVRIRGRMHYLWRAVDQHGNVLDVLVQSRRNVRRPSVSFASC